MSILHGFFRYLRRVTNDSKRHLIGIGHVLGFPASVLDEMRRTGDVDAAEARFLDAIDGRYGGVVDWRADAGAVLAVVAPLLPPPALERLPPVQVLPEEGPGQVVETLEVCLTDTPHALRVLDGFGDFLIVLCVPRDRLPAFDEAAGPWLASPG